MRGEGGGKEGGGEEDHIIMVITIINFLYGSNCSCA